MEIEKQLYEIKIAGLPLKLRSAHNRRTVDELVQVVSGKIKEAQNHNTQISSQNALMLAALHLAEDLILMKRSTQSELELLEVRAREILSSLESSPISQIGLDN